MFPITVTIHTPAQLNAVMALLATDQVPAAKPAKAKPEPKVEAKPEAAEGNVAAASSAPAPQAASAASSTEPAQPAADTPAIAIAEVNAAIIALAKAKGRDAAVAVLGTFGVAKAPELKVEQYAAVVAAAKKAMA